MNLLLILHILSIANASSSIKAKKEAFQLERDCKSKTSNIQKMVRQLKMLKQQVQDIHEQHVKNTQVIQVPCYGYSISMLMLNFVFFGVFCISFSI